MNELRKSIQLKMSEISDLISGDIIPDTLIETGTTYFGYQLSSNYIESNMALKSVNRVSLTGFITRHVDSSENTVEILDLICEEIKNKLNELNFKVSYEDIAIYNNLRKKQITAFVNYSETTNEYLR
jgi:hypothetical protein